MRDRHGAEHARACEGVECATLEGIMSAMGRSAMRARLYPGGALSQLAAPAESGVLATAVSRAWQWAVKTFSCRPLYSI